MQHVKQLGRLQFAQQSFEIVFGIGSRLQSLDSCLAFEKLLDGSPNLLDVRVRADIGVADIANRRPVPTLLSPIAEEEKANTSGARIGAQDLRQFAGIDERQFNLRNDHIGPLRECGFESGGTVRRHTTGVSGDRECVCHPLAPTDVAICDENSLRGHLSFDLDFDLTWF
jgi:hypothetical protein